MDLPWNKHIGLPSQHLTSQEVSSVFPSLGGSAGVSHRFVQKRKEMDDRDKGPRQIRGRAVCCPSSYLRMPNAVHTGVSLLIGSCDDLVYV